MLRSLSAFIGDVSLPFRAVSASCHNTCAKLPQLPPRYIPPHHRKRAPKLTPAASAELPSTPEDHEQLALGAEVEGKVTRLADYGAFVDLGEHGQGLIHISEISNSYVSNISDHLSPDDKVRVRVIAIEQNGRRISLSIRQLDAFRVTGYDRVVQLGGDWGHPWNDDGSANFTDLGPRPEGRHAWEPDLSLFEPWVDPDAE